VKRLEGSANFDSVDGWILSEIVSIFEDFSRSPRLGTIVFSLAYLLNQKEALKRRHEEQLVKIIRIPEIIDLPSFKLAVMVFFREEYINQNVDEILEDSAVFARTLIGAEENREIRGLKGDYTVTQTEVARNVINSDTGLPYQNTQTLFKTLVGGINFFQIVRLQRNLTALRPKPRLIMISELLKRFPERKFDFLCQIPQPRNVHNHRFVRKLKKNFKFTDIAELFKDYDLL